MQSHVDWMAGYIVLQPTGPRYACSLVDRVFCIGYTNAELGVSSKTVGETIL